MKAKPKPSFGSQLRAVMLKNISLAWRQKKSTAFQIVILLLLILTCGIISVALKVQVGSGGDDKQSNATAYIGSEIPLSNRRGNYQYSWDAFNYAVDPSSVNDLGRLNNDSNANYFPFENYQKGLLEHLSQDKFVFSNPPGNATNPLNTSQLFTPNFTPFASFDEAASDLYTQYRNWQVNCSNNNYDYDSYQYVYCYFAPLIPSGAFNFHTVSVNDKHKKIDYELLTLPQAYTYRVPFDTQEIAPVMMHLLHNAAYAKLSNDTFSWDSTTDAIQTTLGSMQISFGGIGIVNTINASIQANLLSLVLCLLIPLFMFKMVAERQSGIMEINRLMGLKPSTYWAANYIHDYIVYLIVVAVLIIAGVAFRMVLFVNVNATLIVLVIVWGHSQISMAYFFGMIFKNWPLSLVFSYGLAFLQIAVAAGLNYGVFSANALPPVWYLIWPGFSFYRAVLLNAHAISSPYNLGNAIGAASQSYICIAWIVGISTLFLLLAMYLDQVLPKELGNSKPFYFPFQFSKWCASDKRPIVEEDRHNEEKPLLIEDESEVSRTMYEDLTVEMSFQPGLSHEADVAQEARNVLSGNIPRDSPLVVKNLTKKFPGASGEKPIIAVDRACFHVRRNDCFGLLGSNGAGKTTLVNMLSGLLSSSTGEALIGGYRLSKDLAKIQSRIGVCLQKDILWDDLTVEEHLLFYARMKGIAMKDEKVHVQNIITEVGLEGERRRLAGDLSGGQKRRLSIAISLMGEPDVIFLDEPSSGLDPGNRRGLWQVIEQIRVNRCLLLTTHSMEEAEALCTRIAIQSLGKMKTIGTQPQLKRKYGTFYKVEFMLSQENHADIQQLLASVNARPELIERHQESITFKVSKEVNLSALVKLIEAQRKALHVKNWGFSESNLEDIFLTIVLKDEEQISLPPAKQNHADDALV